MSEKNYFFLERNLCRGLVLIENEVYENLSIEAYLCGMSGRLVVRNVTFKDCDFIKGSGMHTFFDCVIFKNCTFENCKFDETNIRWSEFHKCNFINCSGSFAWFYGAKFYCDCTYESTHIRINNPTSYSSYGIFNLYKRERRAPAYIGQ